LHIFHFISLRLYHFNSVLACRLRTCA
jgi:hypothetical protein